MRLPYNSSSGLSSTDNAADTDKSSRREARKDGRTHVSSTVCGAANPPTSRARRRQAVGIGLVFFGQGANDLAQSSSIAAGKNFVSGFVQFKNAFGKKQHAFARCANQFGIGLLGRGWAKPEIESRAFHRGAAVSDQG